MMEEVRPVSPPPSAEARSTAQCGASRHNALQCFLASLDPEGGPSTNVMRVMWSLWLTPWPGRVLFSGSTRRPHRLRQCSPDTQIASKVPFLKLCRL